ncbi:MAG TPA: FAD-dependent oxidoreductase, partial [Geminicoccaceae bacterium]
QLDFAGEVRAALRFPVFHAARINDVATARHAIASGKLDMVGMTRAHIADPHIVAKLLRGEEHRVRPCVGMGYCIDRIYQGKDALCIHNAATGREATMPHLVPPSDGPRRKVVVVGGGPGGMEAARVAAARGHEVVLLEATDRLGGQLNLAAKAPGREEVAGIADWLRQELDVLRVDVRLNSYAEADEVLAERPDVVVVATGGLPNTEFLEEGGDLVRSVWDVLGGYVEPQGSVLLYDDHGWHQGPSTALALARAGAKVEVVTPDRMVAFEVGATNFPNYLREAYRHGVALTPDLELRSVRRRGNRLVATLLNEYSGETVEREADHVVVEHGTLPVDELYLALREGSRNGGEVDLDGLARGAPEEIVRNPEGAYLLYRVGDAVSSRNIHAAIYDSLRLCKGL